MTTGAPAQQAGTSGGTKQRALAVALELAVREPERSPVQTAPRT